MNPDNVSSKNHKKQIIKDSELASSDYDTACQNWLRANYKDIANVMYERHTIKKTPCRYRSKRIQSIANDCITSFSSSRKEKDFVLSRIRIALQDKTKQKTKYTVRELEDLCDITNITPNEIMGIAPNPARTVTTLSKTSIEYIRDNFEKFSDKNGQYQVPCLDFPLLGVISIALFERKGFIDDIIARNTLRTNAVSILYKTYLYHGNDKNETYSSDYASMKKDFYWALSEASKISNTHKLIEVPELAVSIKRFFETESIIAHSSSEKYDRPQSFGAYDKPYI